MQTKRQINLTISYPTIATAQANSHQLLRPTFTVTHAAGVKRLSQTEATCLIPSVCSDLHCFGRATDEMRSQQLHSTSSPIRALVKPECRFNTVQKSCKTNKALTSPIWFRTLEHVNRTRLVLMKSKLFSAALCRQTGGVAESTSWFHTGTPLPLGAQSGAVWGPWRNTCLCVQSADRPRGRLTWPARTNQEHAHKDRKWDAEGPVGRSGSAQRP